MPTYLSPGVYVQEVSSGSKPIEGVGTAVAAFIGLAEKGTPNAPTLIANWTQFTQEFGEFIEGSYLAHAVYAYFLNGGGAAYVVRIGADGADGAPLPAAKGELIASGDGGRPVYRLVAAEPGPPGDEIAVEVADASTPEEDTFKLVVS
ncbi:MAG TPA: phage tail sheath family protein, partial [Candidatus Dormibacteraeota bacterium]|nr:phage tail sheath family protein [Candidatus Dormibacteraeota bacterium]